MVIQRGSVLISVMGIAVVLSLAAGGLLLVAGNSRSEEDMAFRRAGCYLDAESGLMMGVGWLRAQGATFITEPQPWGAGNKKIFQPVVLENQSSVTVFIIDNAPIKTVVSRAVNGSEVMQFSWDVQAANTNNPPTLKLDNWRSP